MRLSATNGVQAGRPLKSRTTAQTWPAGAFTTAETKTLGKAPSVVVLAGGRLVALRLVLQPVARDGVEVLRVAHHVRHAPDAAAVDADLLHQAVDHRPLHAV